MVRLSAAACIVEKITGDRPHAATLHRWASRGLKGVKLKFVYAGGHRRTTEEWVREFFDAVTEAASCGSDNPIATKSHEADRAEGELSAAGW
ncbi:MAG: DUF1580 domain-containing protein [Pseudomonadota bacterium]